MKWVQILQYRFVKHSLENPHDEGGDFTLFSFHATAVVLLLFIHFLTSTSETQLCCSTEQLQFYMCHWKFATCPVIFSKKPSCMCGTFFWEFYPCFSLLLTSLLLYNEICGLDDTLQFKTDFSIVIITLLTSILVNSKMPIRFKWQMINEVLF